MTPATGHALFLSYPSSQWAGQASQGCRKCKSGQRRAKAGCQHPAGPASPPPQATHQVAGADGLGQPQLYAGAAAGGAEGACA